MSEKSFKIISLVIILLLSVIFVVKFGLPAVLKAYVNAGIGSCQKIPILCMVPAKEEINVTVDRDYALGLLPYQFPKMRIYMEKGFNVIQEQVKKAYYKKNKRLYKGSVIYVLYQEPNFFPGLFPQLKADGVDDNYEFLKRVMCANINDIETVNDAFFVIMKGIFTPDLGPQKSVKMARFSIDGKRGFINYNFSGGANYFDCNVIGEDGGFFKAYIKDMQAELDLDKVLTIVAEMEKTELNYLDF